MSHITLSHVSKVFPEQVTAVDDISLKVESGEFMVLVGPSGCGKTTLMRMIAGLEDPTTGTIHIGDREVTRLPPRQRDVAMVFQNYALYPHMTVRQNLAYGLKMRRMPKDERGRRVEEVAHLLGLTDLLKRRPAALSGGQRQRVAMGRAIVREPSVFLMDEPLSNLDAKLRVGMRAEIARLHERLGITTVYVTHDQVEAMTLGERVAVMRSGEIEQVDTPQELYERPANLFVAAFMGSPAMNLVRATVAEGCVRFAGHELSLDGGRLSDWGGEVILGIRPEDFAEVTSFDRAGPELEVTVSVLELLGSEVHVIFPIDAQPVNSDEFQALPEELGGTTRLLVDDARALFTARLDRDTRARQDHSLRLTVDSGRLHFFHPKTGESLGRA